MSSPYFSIMRDSRIRAAHKLGVPLHEYEQRVDAGYLWCKKCRRWKLRGDFKASQGGNTGTCLKCLEARAVITKAEHD